MGSKQDRTDDDERGSDGVRYPHAPKRRNRHCRRTGRQHLVLREQGGKIGRLTPDGKITEYRVAEGSEPMSIIAGPDGNMWFTDLKDRIGHIRIPAAAKPAKKN
jgi:hypothetical protein